MIDSLKTKIWELLKEKDVSLAMLYNREGEILWHRGREIKGKTVAEGEGFSKTFMDKMRYHNDTIEEEDVVVTSEMVDLSRSAFVLRIKSLIIQPVGDNFFLYIDSGARESFSETDREIFKVIGSLLGEMIERVIGNENDIGGINGSSGAIGKIRELVLKYTLEEEPVLLLGETGVGKNHIAQLIHLYSGRKGKFVIVNTPGVPDNLIESEIFGHKKGAFTDARSDKRGFVDEAEGGTLFLDEIAEIPSAFQAKLLRFIETRRFQVVGDPAEKQADIRIIAATNRDLRKAIEEKRFREDLYFRLQVLEVEIPPLRERKGDIMSLVEAHKDLLKGKRTGPGFRKAMESYRWPGNVRELITVLRRVGIHADDPVTGEDVRGVIDQSFYKKSLPGSDSNDIFEGFWREIEGGKRFWECVWPLFIKRDLNKAQ
ncbi:MAG: sigma-54-dependent Fis family transcriptional regulator, partial [bacterium]|nr:sigma-54-dependent Fis family transcriptional regulator [bacterium]